MSSRAWGVGRFHPRTLPSTARRAALFVFGPLLWVVALLLAAVAETESGMIAIAGAIAGGTLVVAFLILLPGAIRRHRRLGRR